MLKQTVTYTDFDDVQHTETLYFNISKSELLANIALKDRLEKTAAMLQGVSRDLTVDEIKEVVELVKIFMKISYGIRSEDGRRFKKNDQIWEEFTETAAYDEFFMSLFTEPNKAVEFLMNVVPKDLREQAEQEARNTTSLQTQAAAIVQEQNPFVQPENPSAQISDWYTNLNKNF